MAGFLTLLISSFVLAGTGQGTVTCNSDDGSVIAHYSWFNNDADSYSHLLMIVQEAGANAQYTADNDEALKPLSVKTNTGLTITVKPDLQKSTCVIQVN